MMVFTNLFLKKMFVLLFGMCLLGALNAQSGDPAATRREMDSIYHQNITKSRLYGIYIPRDIDDAFEEFKHLSPAESLQEFSAYEEDLVAEKLHFGIGRWMIVNWSFYEGSRLSHLLREMGIGHPDDMADFLIRVFHRKLNDKEPDMQSLIDTYTVKRAEKLKDKGSIHFYREEDK